MTVTSADVARHAGLSRATVSQVLNGHADRFAADTAERVLRAAEELGYEPSAAGRMLRRGTSDFVIALVPNTTFGGNLQDIFDSVTRLLTEHGLTLVLRLSTQSPASLDRLLAGMRPRAVLSLQPFSEDERQILDQRGIAYFDTSTGGNLNYEIGRVQAEHLVDRGFRQLAFAHLADERQDPYGDDREAAVRDVAREAGLPTPFVISLGIDLEEAASALDQLTVGTGVACYNDDVAIALLTAARKRGWRVPEELGLIGMDNTPLAKVMDPRLTTVGYNLETVAQFSAAAALGLPPATSTSLEAQVDLRVIPGGSA